MRYRELMVVAPSPPVPKPVGFNQRLDLNSEPLFTIN